MLKRENQLRLSTEWQQRFAVAEKSDTRDWLGVVHDLQIQVVVEHGFCGSPDNIQHGLDFLRSAQTQFKGDHELLDIPLYIKYNRAQTNGLTLGSPLSANANVPLTPLFADTTKLQPQLLSSFLPSQQHTQQPPLLVVVSGSFS